MSYSVRLSLALLLAASTAQAVVDFGVGVGFGGGYGYRRGRPAVGVGFGVSTAPRAAYIVPAAGYAVPAAAQGLYWRILNGTDRKLVLSNDSGNELHLAPGATGTMDRGATYELTVNRSTTFTSLDRVIIFYTDQNNPNIIKISTKGDWDPEIGWHFGLKLGLRYRLGGRWLYGPAWRGGYRRGYRRGYRHGRF